MAAVVRWLVERVRSLQDAIWKVDDAFAQLIPTLRYMRHSVAYSSVLPFVIKHLTLSTYSETNSASAQDQCPSLLTRLTVEAWHLDASLPLALLLRSRDPKISAR